LVPAAFLFGIGQASPLQQHEAALSLPLQQEWAFFPFLLFFLQQDMAASLQQPFMSQQASVPWNPPFIAGVYPIADTESAATTARAKTSDLTLLIF
jgi:hypothetical protein